MDADHIRDLFSVFKPVSIRRMFSGAGIYAEGLIFAIIVDDVIYLKVGETNEADFEREKLPPFRYRRSGGQRAAMSYRRIPDRLYDDPDELAQWAARAYAAASRKKKAPAQRARNSKPSARRRLTKR